MYTKLVIKNLRTSEMQTLTDLNKYKFETLTGIGPIGYDTNRIIVRGKEGSVDTGGQLEDREIAMIVKIVGSTPFKLADKVASWKNFILNGDIVELTITSPIRDYIIQGRILMNELREGVGERSFISDTFNVLIYCSDPRFFKTTEILLALAELQEGNAYGELDEFGVLTGGDFYAEIEDPSGDLLNGNFYSLIIEETEPITVFNNGELPTPLFVEFRGPSINPSIVLLRQDLSETELKIIKTLAITERVTIDTDKAEVRLINDIGGTDIEAFGLIDGEPDLRSIVLNPKESTVITAESESGSDKNVRLIYREAYIGIE